MSWRVEIAICASWLGLLSSRLKLSKISKRSNGLSKESARHFLLGLALPALLPLLDRIGPDGDLLSHLAC